MVVGVLGVLMWWWHRIAPHEAGSSKEKNHTESRAGSLDQVPGALARGFGSVRDVGEVLAELRSTYRPGGMVPRIRLQGELNERWEKTPPSAAEVIAEIADNQAPPEHRVFVAHSFRNLAKMNRFDSKEAADVVDALLKIVADSKDDPLVRGQMAITLANFDKSPEAVRAAAGLLDEPSDDAGFLAVTALRHMATDEAAAALYDLLHGDAATLDRKPRTVSAALLALAGHGKSDITSIAKKIVVTTKSAELFQGTLASLSKIQSSTAVIEAVVVAYDSATRLAGPSAERGAEAALRVLRVHARFVESRSNVGSTVEETLFSRARQLLAIPVTRSLP